ncbi:type VI secretion system baseplate subunit TssG [Ensifer adhaerens]|uniref:type VI secretion system baseplate subunit TssG n=1 Tax=Ensifer adhaerens TaxID=106592 RepID=UPI003850F70F
MSSPLDRYLAAVRQKPENFDLFAVLRRVEALAFEHPRLGESVLPNEDPIRLGQQPSLIFSPRTIASVTEPSKSDGDGADLPDVRRIDTYSFGLFGPNGPLPIHFTEIAYSQLTNDGAEGIARFADIFHHRMLSFFFRAWAMSEPTLSHDRVEADRFGDGIAALCGRGISALRNRDEMPDRLKIHFAGRLGSHTRNAEGLRAILSSFVQAAVDVIEFVPAWVRLRKDSLSTLTRSSRLSRLGVSLTVGEKVLVYDHRFRIVVGPLSFDTYQRMLPGGGDIATLVAIVRNYVGDELGFEYNLILSSRDVPKAILGRACRLGWTTWIGTPERDSDVADFLRDAPIPI